MKKSKPRYVSVVQFIESAKGSFEIQDIIRLTQTERSTVTSYLRILANHDLLLSRHKDNKAYYTKTNIWNQQAALQCVTDSFKNIRRLHMRKKRNEPSS